MANEHSGFSRTAANAEQPTMRMKAKYDGELAGMKHHGNHAKILGKAEKSRWEREREYSGPKQDV